MRFVIDRILPKEYKRLKYLENTAGEYANEGAGKPTNVGSYINTGIHPNPNGKVKIGMQFNDWGNNAPYQCIFGGYDNNTRNFGVVVWMKDSHTTYFTDGNQTNQQIYNYVADTHYDFEYDATAKIFTINGTSYNFSAVTGLQTQSELNIYLFTNNALNGIMDVYDTTYTMKGKIYYFKYFEGNALKNNLIPALRVSDNEPGMYDTITGNFFTNAGIGTFSYEIAEEPDSTELLNNPKYKQVEYLESTGTQYIDTGYSPTPTSTYKSIFELTNITTTAGAWFCIFGSVENDNRTFTELFLPRASGDGNVNQIIAGSHNTTYLRKDYAWANNTKYNFEMTPTNVLINSVDQGTISVDASITCSRSIYLFARHEYNDAVRYNVNAKIYQFNVFDNGILVRNFIPALRKSDNKPGMYDKVTGQFFTNAGTGEFLYGRFVGPLPSTYEELDYIESDGNQYIDTGFNVVTSTDEIQLSFQLIETENYKWLFGEHDNSARLGIGSGDGVDKRNVAYYNDTKKVTDTEVYNSKHEFKINSTGVYLNGSKKSNYASFTSTSTLYLFNLNLNGGTTYKAKGKIWSYRHSRNGQWLIDLVPCYKKSNNEAGLYDRVTGKFFANQGTGSFIKGEKGTTFRNQITRLIKSTIASSAQTIGGYRRIDYLESTGTQYIDTGIFGNLNTKIESKVYSAKIDSTSGYGIAGDFTTSTKAITMPINFTSSGLYSRFGDKSITEGIQQQDGTYTIAIDKDGYYVNSIKIANFNTTTAFTTTNTMMLFGFTGLGRNYLVGKMYYCKIWDGDTLVRDFIPVLDENDEPCLYDTVTKQLYKNSGTGNFSYGEVLESSGTRLLNCISDYYKDYKPLKYIQSTGTQYIDTDVCLTNNHSVEISFQMTETSQKRTGIFGGLCNANTSSAESEYGRYGILTHYNNAYYEAGYGKTNIVKSVDVQDLNKHLFYQNENKLYIDGTLVNTFATATFTMGLSAYLGGFRYTSYTPSKAKYYSAKFWDGNILVRNFIPLLRKADNKPGLYDRVNNVFYTNAGTDEFLYETA